MGGTGLLLLGAVAGYWVLERSSGHKGSLKQAGQVIGWAVIIISLSGVTCRVVGAITGKGLCGMKGKGGVMCPFSSMSEDSHDHHHGEEAAQ